MKQYLTQTSLIALICACIVGCDSKPSGSSSSPAQSESTSTAASSAEKDSQTWKLANGTEFSCWVSGDNHAGERSWIWCDVETGPVSFRITGGGQPGDWKPMAKIDVKGDDSKIVADPNGKFGAAQVLPRGKYSVSFKVGAEEFSAVTLQVD